MKTGIGALVLTFLIPALAVAQSLEYWGSAGGWDVMIDPTLGNGCLIQAAYDDGSLVRIGFDLNEDAGYVTALNESWGDIEEGATYDIVIDLDGERYEGEAYGIYVGDLPGADIYFDNSDFLFDIARKYTMTLSNELGPVMAIDLEGTYVGLQEAIRCQEIVAGQPG